MPIINACFVLSLFKLAKRIKIWKVYTTTLPPIAIKLSATISLCAVEKLHGGAKQYTTHSKSWKWALPIRPSSRKLQMYMLHVVLRLNINPHGYTADGLHNESLYQQQDLRLPEGKGQELSKTVDIYIIYFLLTTNIQFSIRNFKTSTTRVRQPQRINKASIST